MITQIYSLAKDIIVFFGSNEFVEQATYGWYTLLGIGATAFVSFFIIKLLMRIIT